MMHVLVMYDIPDDKLRNKVADACLDYGLERVQYSAFVGELGGVHQRELELRMRELVGRRTANIRLIPLDALTWQRQRIIAHGDSAARSVRVWQPAAEEEMGREETGEEHREEE